jgi:putative ABC transport system ATP-binding protein
VPETALAATGVTLTYGIGTAAIRALNEVSLQFTPGRLVLVMGPSGSGKTSLLSVLGCMLVPDRGDVAVNGQLVRSLDETGRADLRRVNIGYVFQAFRLFRALSAQENLLLALDLVDERGATARARALQALESVGMAAKAALKPAQLSGGEKQRVAIARALINDPPIVLADEPTASLDWQSGEQIARMLRQIAEQRRKAVVVVTHDPRMIPFGQRIIRMEDGRVMDDREQA